MEEAWSVLICGAGKNLVELYHTSVGLYHLDGAVLSWQSCISLLAVSSEQSRIILVELYHLY